MAAIKITGALASLTICCGLATATPTATPIAEVFAGETTWSAATDWGSGTDASPAFTPDGKTVYFNHANGEKRTIMVSHLHRGKWSAPKAAEFSGTWRDIEPAMSPDGSFLIFVSNRPAVDGGEVLDGFFGGQTRPGKGGNLWRVGKVKKGWSRPVRLPDIVNTNSAIYSPAIARSGNIYFAQPDPETKKTRMFYSQFNGGKYTPPKPVSFSDGVRSDYDPVVAPDESFIIFSSNRPPTPAQQSGIFIAFWDGKQWETPVAFQPFLLGIEARLSPDLGTLYFTTDYPSLESTQEGLTLSASPAAPRPQRIWDIPLNALIEATFPNKFMPSRGPR